MNKNWIYLGVTGAAVWYFLIRKKTDSGSGPLPPVAPPVVAPPPSGSGPLPPVAPPVVAPPPSGSGPLPPVAPPVVTPITTKFSVGQFITYKVYSPLNVVYKVIDINYSDRTYTLSQWINNQAMAAIQGYSLSGIDTYYILATQSPSSGSGPLPPVALPVVAPPSSGSGPLPPVALPVVAPPLSGVVYNIIVIHPGGSQAMRISSGQLSEALSKGYRRPSATEIYDMLGDTPITFINIWPIGEPLP